MTATTGNSPLDATEYLRHRRAIEAAYTAGGPGQWPALRDLYKSKDSRIRNLWPCMADPYPLDWRFTPIEAAAWQTIRTLGLPLYPQYPVGRYFVDFGDPVTGLAIECDGQAWHNAARDKARDADIGALGWIVKRFTGRQCYLAKTHPESIDAWLQALCSTHYSLAA